MQKNKMHCYSHYGGVMSDYKLFEQNEALQNAYHYYVDSNVDSRLNFFVKWMREQHNLDFRYKQGEFYVRGNEKDLMLFILRWS